jgi:hypothetical protein
MADESTCPSTKLSLAQAGSMSNARRTGLRAFTGGIVVAHRVYWGFTLALGLATPCRLTSSTLGVHPNGLLGGPIAPSHAPTAPRITAPRKHDDQHPSFTPHVNKDVRGRISGPGALPT